MEQLVAFLNHLPDKTYPGVYQASQDHNVLSFVFWWRELWHFFGGIVYGLCFFWVPEALVVVPFFVYMLQLVSEFVNDVPDQGGVADFKNFVDPLFFALGALAILLVIKGGN